MLTGCMIDSREPAHITALRFEGVPTVVATLDAGDLWASTADGALLLVERKTPGDLLASIADKRLLAQITAMRSRSPWVYLVVTGPLAPTPAGKVAHGGRETNWAWDALQGALLSVQELGAGVLFCRDEGDYADAIRRLAQRPHSGEHGIPPRVQGQPFSPGEKVLTALPGIGLERAGRLLDEFDGHAARALAWLTWLDVIGEVTGIGNGVKHTVRRALGLADGESLTVWDDAAASYYQSHRESQKAGAHDDRQPATDALVGV